jgi:hypothetical protein
MTSDPFKSILLETSLYEDLLHLEAEEQYRVSRLIRDALRLYSGLSYYARTQFRDVTSEHPEEMPRLLRAVSATVSNALLRSNAGKV